MLVKRYIVNNMNEAMTRIRYELGRDAIIISQKRIRKHGLAGLFSKKMYEVTAACDNEKGIEQEDVQDDIKKVKKIIKSNTKLKKQSSNRKKENESSKKESEDENLNDEDLAKEMHDMKLLINQIAEKQKKPVKKTEKKSKLESMLLKNDVDPKIVKKILTKVNNRKSTTQNEKEKAKDVVKKMISVSKAEFSKAVVLVGPTGVGKTTTIAKLAGNAALVHKKKVGLITIDTYRIGAVEQLKTYADIMNLPFRVVVSIKDMEKALNDLSECDTILVDTTGRSSRNSMQISELRAYIEKVNTDNIHLVISCTTKNSDIPVILKGYEPLNYKDIIITKLDETSSYGSILNIIEMAKKPVSFLATGQNVPDDLKMPKPEEICDLIFGDGDL